MEQYPQITAQYIQIKFKLPKLTAKKIQQANRFINDPHSALKTINQKNFDFLSHANDHQQKTKKNTKHKYTKTTTLQQQTDHSNSERQLVSLKMKKFRPANGSFSQFYGQKQSLNTQRITKSPSKLDLTRLQLGLTNAYLNKNPSNKIKRTHSKQAMSQISIGEITNTNSKEYPFLQKIKMIRQTSQMLRQNSKGLSKRANIASTINQNCYEKLQNDSNQMLTGQQKYIFDEQMSRTYRNNALQGHMRWVSKK